MIDYKTLMKDYKTLIKLVEKYNEEASRIFYKLKTADQEATAGILHFGRYSSFEKLKMEYSDDNSLSIVYYDYGYDIHETDCLSIPADILFDDEKIDKWIKSEVDKALEKKEQQRKAKEKYQEEKERQEYERLKEKFGI
jgi:hypothetical protein